MIIPRNILEEKDKIPINIIYQFKLEYRQIPYIIIGAYTTYLFKDKLIFLPFEIILLYIFLNLKYQNQYFENIIFNYIKYVYEKAYYKIKG